MTRGSISFVILTLLALFLDFASIFLWPFFSLLVLCSFLKTKGLVLWLWKMKSSETIYVKTLIKMCNRYHLFCVFPNNTKLSQGLKQHSNTAPCSDHTDLDTTIICHELKFLYVVYGNGRHVLN